MDIKDIRAVTISLASPEKIHTWSYGEVTKPETINYRRLRPEKDGLFCEAIFGPTKDWQCYCGKYKKIRYKGIICEKCGVEVTHSRVRRERMGHIDLAAPVAHIWYTRRSPSYLGLLLDISQRNLDRVLYFAQYIIISVDEDARQKALRRLDEEMNREMARLTKTAQDQVEQIDQKLTQDMEGVSAERAQLMQELESKIAVATDKLMSEAAALQQRLDTFRERPATENLVFAPSDKLILEAGEIATRDHYPVLNQAAQDKLGLIEREMQEEQATRIAPLDARIEYLRRSADEDKAAVQEKLGKELEDIRGKVEDSRDDLMLIKPLQLLNENRCRELEGRWGKVFKAGMGAEAIYEIVAMMNLENMAESLRTEVRTSRSKQRSKKAAKRLRVVESLRKSNNRPEWMILTVLPVIPPDLRPMVQLDGGRFATSDLNDLYRRVVNRNNRLKHLIKLQAPEVIVRNEKRMLQEAVDSLVDNSRRGKAISLRGRRQLKSLSDMLKGKQGRFRRNLLGKRVDYSGRSVIVVGPDLRLHQCGLPKRMALELFRPFVMRKLVEYNHAINVKGAKRLIEREVPEVWEVLEEVIKTRPVLLNRAPTLHRLGIQAFEPLLVEGNAIQIHPLVCSAFNADFDGDQMAVHVPLSDAAVKESRELMLSGHNLLLPATGEPTVGPTKDMVLGCYYLTMEKENAKGEGKIFSSYDEVELAMNLGKVDLHAKIKFLVRPTPSSRKEKMLDTTVGRVLFNQAIPVELRFKNALMDKGGLKRLISEAYQHLGPPATAELSDQIKSLGFRYATRSGVTVAIDDLSVPKDKAEIIDNTSHKVSEIERLYRRGLVTENELYRKTVDLWQAATDEVTDAVARDLDRKGNIGIMAYSGATKMGLQPVRQLSGMRGLMADPSGRIIPLPIRSNFREGLNALEYFISTHGARKGLADTAMRTADAGYLTRRLVDVAQDAIINVEDCGTHYGVWIRAKISQEIGEPFGERLAGRIAAAPIINPKTGEVIVGQTELIEEKHIPDILEAGISEVLVRSALTCQLRYGVCSNCYGRDLAKGSMIQIGEAVGIIAAQSIGEPGTQLTLRTFHTGGVAGGSDITQGLPRVQELFEARLPKGQAIISDISGVIELRREGDMRWVKVVAAQVNNVLHRIPDGYTIVAEDGDKVDAGEVLASKADSEDITAQVDGVVALEGTGQSVDVYVRTEEREEREYEIPAAIHLRVEDGQHVEAGEQLTDGTKNPHEILRIMGTEAVREYLVEEIQKVYRSQGVAINDKHIEVIVRQMLRRVRIKTSGDTPFLPGEYLDRIDYEAINAAIVEQNGEPATATPVLLGITKAALNTESFLSAASFQHTISVLAEAAIEGRRDDLHGLKESVIIGKLIPAGTGYRSVVQTGVRMEATMEGIAAALNVPRPLGLSGLLGSSADADDEPESHRVGEDDADL